MELARTASETLDVDTESFDNRANDIHHDGKDEGHVAAEDVGDFGIGRLDGSRDDAADDGDGTVQAASKRESHRRSQRATKTLTNAAESRRWRSSSGDVSDQGRQDMDDKTDLIRVSDMTDAE